MPRRLFPQRALRPTDQRFLGFRTDLRPLVPYADKQGQAASLRALARLGVEPIIRWPSCGLEECELRSQGIRERRLLTHNQLLARSRVPLNRLGLACCPFQTV